MAVTAESCTGGGVAYAITEIAGSSAWFDRGFVTYTNLAKSQMLGVEPDLIRCHGAVSEAVVRAMAIGALCMGPAGLVALLAGWITTEVGRQPWVVYGLQRTQDAVSAHGVLPMTISLLTFFVVYLSVFGLGYAYMIRLIKLGPESVSVPASQGTPARPLSAAQASKE